MNSLAVVLSLLLPPQQTGIQDLVARRPDSVRDSVAVLLATAGTPGDAARLDTAGELARAYAATWPDSSLLVRVTFVQSLDQAGRTQFRTADSLRRAGNEALYASGVAVSLSSWRRSLEIFGSLGDSLGVAATSGNIGAGFYVAGVLDSATLYLERARLMALRTGAPRSAANATTILGNVAYDRGDYGRALDLYGSAAEYHALLGNFEGVAQSLNNRGLLAEETGDDALAAEEYSHALSVATEHGHGVRRADYLLNMGRLRGNAGDFRGAFGLLEEALAIYHEAGETANEALAFGTIAAIHTRRSDYHRAIEAYSETVRLYHQSNYGQEELAARRDLAVVLAATGNLDSSLTELAGAERLSGTMDVYPGVVAGIHLARGDIELRLNRVTEARASYREAGRFYRVVRDAGGIVAAQMGLAHADIFSGSFDGAIATITSLLETGVDSRERAQAQLLLGYALTENADYQLALASLTAAAAAFEEIGDEEGRQLTVVEIARAETARGNVLRSEAMLRQLLDRASEFHQVEWRAWYGLARALEESGREQAAAAAYRSAIDAIEATSGSLPGGLTRGLYLTDKWEVYERFAVLLSRTGRADDALETSEAMRSRAMLDIRARGPVEYDRAEEQRERELRERVASYSARYTVEAERGRRGGSPTPRLGALAAELAAARAEYGRYVETLDALSVPPSVPAAATARAPAIARRLGGSDILLEYLVAEDELLLFAVTGEGTRVFQVGIPRTELEALVDFARAAIAENPRDERELWRAPLARLGRLLLGPVLDSGMLAGRARIMVVPHRELHYLPFEALITDRPTGPHYLIDDFEIEYLPSASVWLQTTVPSQVSGEPGVLAVAPIANGLPGTSAEVTAIESSLPYPVDVMRPPAATETALRTTIANYDIIHLATRGVLNRHNPLFSYVSINPGDGDDGRLEVHEVARLGLHADLVVLSACETGLGSGRTADVPPGDDWVGLVGSFIEAGAGNVLATLWAIDDVATANLISGFYRQVAAGQTYVAALAATKRDFIAEPTTAHPFYWAGFTLTTARASRVGRM